MNEEDCCTADAMKEFGGSFVKTLGELAWHADSINLKKIKNTWPEYWEEYRQKSHKTA